MGYRFRKRIKILPGLHVTFSPSGMSTSFGVNGARITFGSTGRVTRTLGIPGTGFYHMETIGNTRKKSRDKKAELPPGAIETATGELLIPGPPGYPNIFSRKYEKRLYSALQTDTSDAMSEVLANHPETALTAGFFLSYFLVREGKNDRALETLTQVWQRNAELPTDPLFIEYANPHIIEVIVAPSAKVMMRVDRDCVGLFYAELLQMAGKIEDAIEVVETLTPNQGVAISRADLYVQVEQWDKIIELSNDVSNEDDVNALLLVYRGIAFREKGFNDAAREVFKEALSSKKRSESIRLLAMTERAFTYIKDGKLTLAKREMEKVMAADPDDPGIARLEAALKKDS